MLRFSVLAPLILFCAACSSVSARYQAYGPVDRAAERRVVAAFEAAKDRPAPDEVVVYNAIFPDGVYYDNGELKVEDGAPFEAIGQFTLIPGAVKPTGETMIDHMKRIAEAAGGNLVVFRALATQGGQRLNRAGGVVLRYTGPGDPPPAPEPNAGP